jgi:hypothetical protein
MDNKCFDTQHEIVSIISSLRPNDRRKIIYGQIKPDIGEILCQLFERK